ncbi:MAG: hypothetical protein HY901_03470 [Deltaproteobacteria bacterium]|nr:hypothetical protein [Deltaproteobacteria bacterium]
MNRLLNKFKKAGGANGILKDLRPQLERLASPAVKARQKAAEEAAATRFGGAPDKISHAAMTALISGLVTEVTGNPVSGMTSALGLGLAKELLIDGTPLSPNGHCDLNFKDGDMAANYLGAAYGAGFALDPARIRVRDESPKPPRDSFGG